MGLLNFEKEKQEEYKKRLVKIEDERLRLEKLCERIIESESPILLTEGKTDVIILEIAWKKLFPDKTRSFRIISCDPLTDENSSAAGADMLKKALESCRTDQPKTIGLFDRDEKGIKSFDKLDNNFIVQDDNLVKLHKNSNVAAFLIPDIPGKEEYIQSENLPIEFLFPEDRIITSINGRSLKLKQKKCKIIIGNIIQREEDTHEHCYRKIVENKFFFADKIVPTFSKDSFENFIPIFEYVAVIIELMDQ